MTGAALGSTKWGTLLFAVGFKVARTRGCPHKLLCFTAFLRADRANAVAASRLGLGASAHPAPSFDGERVGPFGAAGARTGVQPGDHLVTVNGKLLPADIEGRTTAMAGPHHVPVTLTLRRDDSLHYEARIMWSPSYKRVNCGLRSRSLDTPVSVDSDRQHQPARRARGCGHPIPATVHSTRVGNGELCKFQ
jgi:hypothetical protein